MKNMKIRKAASSHMVKHWEIASALGISENWFCRKLRTELPEEEQTRIIGIIEQIAAERGNVYG